MRAPMLTRARMAIWIVCACLAVATGCGSGSRTSTTGQTLLYDQDTVLAELMIGPNDTVRLLNGAILTVSGNADIQGLLEAISTALRLHVQGNLKLSGTVRTMFGANLQGNTTDPPVPDPDMPFSDQPSGVFIQVDGDFEMTQSSNVSPHGPLVITDDEAQFARTPADIALEANSPSDDLPTIVPLQPEDPIFAEPLLPEPLLPARVATAGIPRIASGTIDGADPTTYIRFNGPRDLHIQNLTAIPPVAIDGAPDDGTADPGEEARGQNGRNGADLNIWNNGGSITVFGGVVLNLSSGGDGGDATAVCALARGGAGGEPGGLRMTAANGISIAGGLRINPGVGGNGGEAKSNKGAPGGPGCPGERGRDADAIGGDGADHRRRFFVRGNVTGLDNITVGSVVAGNGGPATAAACDGGPGNVCCQGGAGGDGNATGGDGGDARLNLGSSGFKHEGVVQGGTGGNATATGGDGKKGGDCKFGDGGNGGQGGNATAEGGRGGDGTALGGATNGMGGNSGSATATPGNGGQAGGSGFGMAGMRGDPGGRTANAGVAGTPDGVEGTETENDGSVGTGPPVIPTMLFCIPMEPFVSEGQTLPPGVRMGHPVQDQAGGALGQVDIVLQDVPGAGYVTSTTPKNHIGIQNGGVFEICLPTLMTNPAPGQIIGLQIVPLFGSFDPVLPPIVEVLGAEREILGSYPLETIPDNQGSPTSQGTPDNPVTVDVDFVGVDPTKVSKVQIRVQESGFVTFLVFYLVDP